MELTGFCELKISEKNLKILDEDNVSNQDHCQTLPLIRIEFDLNELKHKS